MEWFKKLLNIIFVCGVIAFMSLGTVIVAVQAYSVLTANGNLAISINKTLAKPAFVIATITGLIGFAQGYINGWEMGD